MQKVSGNDLTGYYDSQRNQNATYCNFKEMAKYFRQWTHRSLLLNVYSKFQIYVEDGESTQNVHSPLKILLLHSEWE